MFVLLSWLMCPVDVCVGDVVASSGIHVKALFRTSVWGSGLGSWLLMEVHKEVLIPMKGSFKTNSN